MAAIVFAIVVLSTLCHTEAQTGGFSVELIHRDSVKSPFYNSSETSSDRVSNALRRSFGRVHRFMPKSVFTMTAEAEIIPSSGEYLMNISFGTPPFEILAIVDTGSDLIWTQCEPCSNCLKHDGPIFDPRKSSTYRKVTCTASQCVKLEDTSCSKTNTCEYSILYGDDSFSNGDLVSDTITLASTSGRRVAVRKRVFGCGLNNGGMFGEKTSGIIGLGSGRVSLISQLGTSIAGKFSYCLLPFFMAGNSSKMNFGSHARVSGRGVVSTPLVKKSHDTFYYLTLETVSIGTKRINFTGSTLRPNRGNTIIDSGTTLTLLPSVLYSEIESAMTSQINATRVRGLEGLTLCYEAQNDIKIPDVTMHFTKANVVLKPLNTFIMVSETALCFTFSSVQDELALYGNLAQINFLIGYDTKKHTVSFKPTDCSKN